MPDETPTGVDAPTLADAVTAAADALEPDGTPGRDTPEHQQLLTDLRQAALWLLATPPVSHGPTAEGSAAVVHASPMADARELLRDAATLLDSQWPNTAADVRALAGKLLVLPHDTAHQVRVVDFEPVPFTATELANLLSRAAHNMRGYTTNPGLANECARAAAALHKAASAAVDLSAEQPPPITGTGEAVTLHTLDVMAADTRLPAYYRTAAASAVMDLTRPTPAPRPGLRTRARRNLARRLSARLEALSLASDRAAGKAWHHSRK